MQYLVCAVKDRCGEVSEDRGIKFDLNAMVRGLNFIPNNIR